MKNKKRKQSRILLLLLLLIGTAGLLSTATFAWFTANKTVKVEEIKVNVEAQGGIQISTDATTWKALVSQDDIRGAKAKYAAAINQLPVSLKPVSTAKDIDENGRMKMFLGTVLANTGGDYILTATQDVEKHGTAGNFIAFDLFFKSDGANELNLTTNSQIVTEDLDDTGIKNAARIAFVKLGHTTAGDTLTNIQKLNAGTSAETKIWEPNFDVHTAAAVNHAQNTYGETVQQAGNPDALAYSGVQKAITQDNNVKVGEAKGTTEYVKPVVPDFKTKANFDQKVNSVLSLQTGITKVRIYMWIEGQDVDCENSASGGSTTFNLQFTTE